jgi:hypothetical protein
MGKRFDWRLAKLRGRQTRSLADEDEQLNRDRAASWLAKAGSKKLQSSEREIIRNRLQGKLWQQS